MPNIILDYEFSLLILRGDVHIEEHISKHSSQSYFLRPTFLLFMLFLYNIHILYYVDE